MLVSDLLNRYLNSEFALTGAIYCEQESLVQDLTMRLRQTAGNFYINDKVKNAIHKLKLTQSLVDWLRCWPTVVWWC